MPIYEYRCQSCETIVETIQSFSAPPLTTCEKCGGELRKLISRSAFHLKGSGWYSDHYGLKDSATSSKKESGSAEAKPEVPKPEKKTESKGDSGGAKPESKSESKGDSGGAKPESKSESKGDSGGAKASDSSKGSENKSAAA
jgi:putative FmdB family regulatory protein